MFVRLFRFAYPLALLATALLLVSACAAGGDSDGDGGTDIDADTSGDCTTDSDCTDDGIFCNGPAVCRMGECVAGMPPTCMDGVNCTEDSCSTVTDECQNVPNAMLCPAMTVCEVGMGCVTPRACEFDSECGDGVFCNGDEVCVGAACMSPGMRSCDDGDSCTVDSCVESAGACSNIAAENLTDALYCGPTGVDDCSPCTVPGPLQANMTAACTAGACSLECLTGFFDSDADLANGCECEGGAGMDDPDDMYLDTNCDMIDGDRARGILVSSSMGNDTATCGLEFDRACRTIAFATTRAITESRRDLFLMAGAYDEIVSLRDGIRIFGGYDTGWVRGPRTDIDHRTTITGGLDATTGQYVTILAHDLVVAPMLENLIITGPNAAMDGFSSYAIHAKDAAGLDVVRCSIQQGHGAAGAAGAVGDSAPVPDATVGMGGTGGGNASAYISVCDDVTFGAGGGAGGNSCSGGPSSAIPNAGGGGGGGLMDNTCTCVLVCFCTNDDCIASAGANGTSASQNMTSGFGFRGAGGAGANTCDPGTAGNDGRLRNGMGGPGATGARGTAASDFWIGELGGPGTTGENGGGGGGGGGSGGCDTGTIFLPGDNSHGAGGGGGGSGGCAARGGGGGGGGAGSSFGVFSVRSTVAVSNCELQRGNGGVGGLGGVGGRGQSGGPGGLGGTAVNTSANVGGAGGAGGHGGHGGGGGGGAGGLSFGVFSLSSTVDASSSIFAGGSAGAAGLGGPSAPTAPLPERDGDPGSLGVPGVLGDVFVCAAPGGC